MCHQKARAFPLALFFMVLQKRLAKEAKEMERLEKAAVKVCLHPFKVSSISVI